MAKKRQRPNKGRVKTDRTEAQKRYLRKHFAEQEELNQDDQWNRQGLQRLSYYEKLDAARTDNDTDDSARRDTGNHDGSTDRDSIPF